MITTRERVAAAVERALDGACYGSIERAKEAAAAELCLPLEAARIKMVTVRGLFERWRELELVSRTTPGGERMGRRDSGALVLAQCERHVFPVIGDMAAADVRRADILRVLDAQLAAGKRRTAQMIFADLRQMFAFALDRELIAADPMATLKKARIVGTGAERDRALSVNEVRDWRARRRRKQYQPRQLGTCVTGKPACHECMLGDGYCRKEVERYNPD